MTPEETEDIVMKRALNQLLDGSPLWLTTAISALGMMLIYELRKHPELADPIHAGFFLSIKADPMMKEVAHRLLVVLKALANDETLKLPGVDS